MTAPKLAQTVKGKGRHYRSPDGDLFPSVTNILGVIDKPAIAWWQTKGALAAAWDDRAAFSRMRDRDVAVKAYQSAAFKQRDKAADLGSHIHAVCEALTSDTTLPEVDGDAEAPVGRFLDWVTEHDVRPVMSERTVMSTQHRYAGTFDLVADVGGRRLLVDIKTGKAVYPESALQVTALAYAEHLCESDGTLTVNVPVDGGAVLHLRPDRFELVEVDTSHATFAAFLGARLLWEFVKGGGADTALGATP